MLYYGRVTRVVDDKVYCTINELGGQDHEFGPLPVIEWTLPENYSTYTDSQYAHINHSHPAMLASSQTVMSTDSILGGGEMIPYGNFESGIDMLWTGDLPIWMEWVTGDVHSGTHCLEVGSLNGENNLIGVFGYISGCTVGARYEVSTWIKVTAGDPQVALWITGMVGGFGGGWDFFPEANSTEWRNHRCSFIATTPDVIWTYQDYGVVGDPSPVTQYRIDDMSCRLLVSSGSNDAIVVAQIGLLKEDLVVLGTIPSGQEHE